jgi:hypothetical protein
MLRGAVATSVDLAGARDRIRFLLVHHEEAAAFMATGPRRAPDASACASRRRARPSSNVATLSRDKLDQLKS